MKYIFVKKFYLFAVTLIISSNCICAQQAVLLSGNTPGNAEYINNPANNTSALETRELKKVSYPNLWPGVNLNISGFVLTYTLTNLNRAI